MYAFTARDVWVSPSQRIQTQKKKGKKCARRRKNKTSRIPEKQNYSKKRLFPFTVFTHSTRATRNELFRETQTLAGAKADGVSVFLLNLIRSRQLLRFLLCLSNPNPFLPVFCNPLITVTLSLARGGFCWVEQFSANNTKSYGMCISPCSLVTPNTNWLVLQ